MSFSWKGLHQETDELSFNKQNIRNTYTIYLELFTETYYILLKFLHFVHNEGYNVIVIVIYVATCCSKRGKTWKEEKICQSVEIDWWCWWNGKTKGVCLISATHDVKMVLTRFKAKTLRRTKYHSTLAAVEVKTKSAHKLSVVRFLLKIKWTSYTT